jgi:protein MpaA
LATFRRDDRDWEMPAYRFLGPKLDAPALRLAVFAGIAGDELEGIMGVTAFVTRLAANPALATGINLHLYPNCNPTGLDRQQRDTSAGLDLARQLWSGSRDAEAAHLTREIRRRRFHGWVTLHSHRRPDTFLVEAGADPASQALADDLLAAINTRLPAVVVNRSGSRCGFLRPPGDAGSPFTLRLSVPRPRPQHLQQAAIQAALIQLLGLCRAARGGSIYFPADHEPNPADAVHL